MKTLKKLLASFRMPSAAKLAQDELEEAQRSLLKAQTAQEWAKSEVTYNRDRISRLQGFLAQQNASGAA